MRAARIARAVACAAAILVARGTALAQGAVDVAIDVDVDVDVDALVSGARRAEDDARPREARAAWQQVVDAAPTSRHAARARQRIEWLDERAEGDFAPLAILMRARARPASERDRAAIAELEDAVAGMPAGRVRIEARQLIAGEWARLGERDHAISASEALLAEPELRVSDRALARETIARGLEASGRGAEALSMLEDAGLERSFVHGQIAAERRRAVAVPIAIALLALFTGVALAIALPALRRDARGVLRRGLAPSRIAMFGWATLVPLAIASAYDHEATDTFALLALGCGAVLAVASIGGASSPPRRMRVTLAVLTVIAALAVGYLVGDREDALLGF